MTLGHDLDNNNIPTCFNESPHGTCSGSSSSHVNFSDCPEGVGCEIVFI